jgi:diguanylate cyclase (GGDEF)-like protein
MLMPRRSEGILDTQTSGNPFMQSLAAAGACTYHWQIGADAISWSPNAASVLGVPGADAIDSGRNFAGLLDPGNVTSRFEAVMRSAARDMGEGVGFRIEYLLRPQGRQSAEAVWVEDHGRWYAGPDGKPAEVMGVLRRIDERQKREQSLRYLGNFDPLTGMMNRGRFSEALGEAIAAARAKGKPSGLLLISISNINSINEAYGYETAEETIVAIARRLRHSLRQGDTIGRFSGSKFGVILHGCPESEMENVAERFLEAARESMVDTVRGPVWASLAIGCLSLPAYGKNAAEAIAHAEEALTEARRTQTDRAIPYRPDPKREQFRLANAKAGTDIVDSLRADRFCLAYQPIVRASDNFPVMHEVLLRLRQLNGEVVSASHLIPVAETLGLIRLVDDKVATLALDTLARCPDASLTLNVSGITATDPRWYARITDRIAAYGKAAGRLVVEITETAALQDLHEISRFIGTLKDLGCKVAIDDFGAGYTSFRNLRDLNVDLVKLDGGFCVGLANNRDNQFFVRTLLDLAKQAGLQTVAEWVESEEDAELLRNWGADYLQGYLFGRAENELPWAASAQAATLGAESAGLREVFSYTEPAALERRRTP